MHLNFLYVCHIVFCFVVFMLWYGMFTMLTYDSHVVLPVSTSVLNIWGQVCSVSECTNLNDFAFFFLAHTCSLCVLEKEAENLVWFGAVT